MANIKSAIKRVKTNEKSRQANKAVKSALKTSEKKFMALVEEGKSEDAANAYKEASRKFDRAASSGVIHKNAANRKKSNLAKKLDALK